MNRKPPGRPPVRVEQFEALEVLARAEPETARLEFIHGRIEVKQPRDSSHDEILAWLRERCRLHRPDLRLYPGRGLRVGAHGSGRARPDGVLAPPGHFAGAGEWAGPGGVLMVTEVTRDGCADVYAAAGVPVHLLIDPVTDTLTVQADADRTAGRYRFSTTRVFGAVVTLPEPVGVTLETLPLRNVKGGLQAPTTPSMPSRRRSA